MVVLLVLFAIISFLTIDYFVQRAERTKLAPEGGTERSVSGPAAAPGVDELPRGLFVGPGHVWVQLEPSGAIRIGVDRLLLALLGGVEFAYTLPEGAEVRRGGPLMMLRRGDRALKIQSPVDGVVCGVNQHVKRSPGRIASAPFDTGWLYRVSPVRLAGALQRMRVADAAADWMRDEVGRLREHLLKRSGAAEATLADGGLPVGRLDSLLGDRDWAEVVAGFFRSHDSGIAKIDIHAPDAPPEGERCDQPS